MDKIDVCKMTILYITSDRRSIDTIGKLLYSKYQSHKLLFADDCIDAISHLVISKPDISIVDMNIHPVNYTAVINELSKQNKIDQTIFIDAPDNNVLNFFDFKYCLTTPISTDRLSEIIDTIAAHIFFDQI